MKDFDPEIDKSPKADELWFYKETGNFYLVTRLLRMKIADGLWVEGVVYERHGLEFCRDLQTFGEKFSFHKNNY